ncbi:trafficking kinesin-binding protein milt isoform X5 [Cryptotermes secundus]|uniref:trafficking kinesin-binding protein milt isoform X5 n=1 Tax=Cryptotermes secundus TaxID=105785 RepID=UPI000CD7CA8F|nr:trafficking kinesin-binding protein milt isoform X5 [Cryptotermes secundus]
MSDDEPSAATPAVVPMCSYVGDHYEDRGEWSRFLYYVARDYKQKGRPYIRVVRTLLLDEVLCSNRVSQMTKTYNDIEAVTRLLEEKEKDLELTARIGKELLTHNQKLDSNVAALEAELKQANEKLTQLNHELAKKTELIQILTNDVDESGSESGTPTSLRCINLEFMQRRIWSLEEENKQLRSEASQLAHDTEDCEMAEQRLVQDIASQLANANMEVDGLADELQRQKEESRQQHEEIAILTSKLLHAESQINKLTAENDELSSNLHITRDNQRQLAGELADLKDRYAEVLSLLRDTQEQLRRQRRKGMPQARGGLFSSLGTTAHPDSIASELESSLYSELSLDSGIGVDCRERMSNYKKVFETVRCASRGSSSSAGSSPIHQMYPTHSIHLPTGGGGTMMQTTATLSSSGPRMSAFVPISSGGPSMGGPQPLRPTNRMGGSSVYSSSLSFPSMDSQHSDSEFSVVTDTSDECYPGGARAGVPGVPGAADLEAALRRLTPAEVLARRATLSSGLAYTGYDYPDGPQTPPNYLPYGCRTPDSIMSTGSSGLSGFSGHTTGSWKLPEKLQIVKPLEGSLTLATWSQLATPTLGGLLDERPGVKIRGGRQLEDLGLELYSLSDLEEDEECVNPGKSFQSTGSVYTYTNSTVLHPDDNTSVTPSLRGSQMCTVASSRQPTAPQTPVTLSRRGSTTTFSTTLGLAKMLNERGIKAVTPSAVATPCGDRSFTPTATPCNSPDGTPPPSPPPSPPPYNPLKFPGFLTSGADLLRRKLTGDDERQAMKTHGKNKRSKMALSRSERKALTGIRLVEKLERIGLDTIMATTAAPMSALTLQGALYTRRTLKSPMAQLTSFKSAIASPGMVAPTTSSVSTTVKASESEAMKISTASLNVEQGLGVPGRPGSGLLDRPPPAPERKHQRTSGMVRPDLGTVLGSVPAKRSRDSVEANPNPGTLGTISSLLFGRKGGLL